MNDQMLNPIALDIETAPIGDAPSEYALQPWRYLEGTAEITCISVARASGEALLVTKASQFRGLLASLKGKLVWTHNGIFDVAWLIAYGLEEEVKAIQWGDTMTLAKWAYHSQRHDRFPAWDLGSVARHQFKGAPWVEAFCKMKSSEHGAGENQGYWEQRAKLDAIVTARIAQKTWNELDQRRRKSSMITMSSIVPLARSWVIGVDVDFSLIDEAVPIISAEMAKIEYTLGVHNDQHTHTVVLDESWTPSKVLRSPKQLADLLYKTWAHEPKHFSAKTGQPSADKTALTYLSDTCDAAIDILRWRKLDTQLSRYIQAPLKAREYLGSDTMHPSPKLFATYTGRMTYTSKTSRKFATGVALHQWPREKEFRALIVPRKGYKHVEFDAAGQESRLMADKSGDYNMREAFIQGKDFHSVTGSRIAGLSYEAFIKGKEEGNSAITGTHGFRYQGKFCNLSNNFRIGVKKLRLQSRVQYGMDVDFIQAKQWHETFFHLFPGVKKYWGAAIAAGKTIGYAETLAGRRFKLSYWGKDDRWGTESSALMFPIQGSGADMKDLAIQELTKHYPQFVFWFDLHDGLHMQVPEEVPNSVLLEARQMLDDLDYNKWWGYTPSIPLTWDVSVGTRWSQLEELD